MKVCVYGFRGNMGRRYTTILEYLGHSWTGVEFMDDRWGPFAPESADAVIVATPTRTHTAMLRKLKDCGKPILVEKPITKDLGELEVLIGELRQAGTRVEMVNQYDQIAFPRDGHGPTVYDYFKSGGDGLHWDCISIIYHANGELALHNASPIWSCVINGTRLSLADMDEAYVEMVDRWLRDPRDDLTRIWRAHKKVDALCRQKS